MGILDQFMSVMRPQASAPVLGQPNRFTPYNYGTPPTMPSMQATPQDIQRYIDPRHPVAGGGMPQGLLSGPYGQAPLQAPPQGLLMQNPEAIRAMVAGGAGPQQQGGVPQNFLTRLMAGLQNLGTSMNPQLFNALRSINLGKDYRAKK